MGSLTATDDPEWTDAQLAELETQKFDYIKTLHDLGHGKRYWDDIKVGTSFRHACLAPTASRA